MSFDLTGLGIAGSGPLMSHSLSSNRATIHCGQLLGMNFLLWLKRWGIYSTFIVFSIFGASASTFLQSWPSYLSSLTTLGTGAPNNLLLDFDKTKFCRHKRRSTGPCHLDNMPLVKLASLRRPHIVLMTPDPIPYTRNGRGCDKNDRRIVNTFFSDRNSWRHAEQRKSQQRPCWFS